jgi:pimeloyl-ACP methyl ester carboxylesterase
MREVSILNLETEPRVNKYKLSLSDTLNILKKPRSKITPEQSFITDSIEYSLVLQSNLITTQSTDQSPSRKIYTESSKTNLEPVFAKIKVFIHGTGLNSTAFHGVGKLFEENNCIYFDRPGYGFSDIPEKQLGYSEQARLLNETLEKIIEQNGWLGKIELIGNSLGGTICIEMAQQWNDFHPENTIDQVVAISSAKEYGLKNEEEIWLDYSGESSSSKQNISSEKSYLSKLLTTFLMKIKKLRQSQSTQKQNQYEKQELEYTSRLNIGYGDKFDAKHGFDLLTISGDSDFLVPTRSTKKLQAYSSDKSLKTAEIKTAAHSMPYTQPIRLANAIAEKLGDFEENGILSESIKPERIGLNKIAYPISKLLATLRNLRN